MIKGKYFQHKELTRFDCSPEIEARLQQVCNVLDKIREEFGKAIVITSGYRPADYNKKIGGASNSAHVKGWAVDITSANNLSLIQLMEVMANNGEFNFDQIINEKPNNIGYPSWIHLSIEPRFRKQKLVFSNNSYKIVPKF
ncbi:MAG: hypothetical protein HUJ76_11960 [Parasporobacterium sp.]|nr:hypothetical protein [Parasporobacterium sp.]